MRKVDLAYLAGFFDGEGYIGIRKHEKTNYLVRATVCNTNKWIVEWYRFAFGGSINLKSKYSPKHHDAWVWDICGKNAIAFLEAISPYLKTKRTQAELAIKFSKEKQCSHGGEVIPPLELFLREEYKKQLSQLNREGGKTNAARSKSGKDTTTYSHRG